MIEHLGPTYFSPEDFQSIVQGICGFANHNSAALRQASAYGIGCIAQHSGEAFQSCAELCLSSLKSGVDFAITPKIQDKKEKLTMYHHARDKAIASIGKVIKYQTAYVQGNAQIAANLVTYWIGLLPITHDVEEAAAQYEYLSFFLEGQPDFIFCGNPANAATQIAKVYGEAFQDKYTSLMSAEVKQKIAGAVRFLQSAPQTSAAFVQACESLPDDAKANI